MNETTRAKRFSNFELYGTVFNGESGDERFGDCPFCGGRSKFYVNTQTMLWDCKKCSKSGNFWGFLRAIAEQAKEDFDSEEAEALAKDRGLPVEAFAAWDVGYNVDSEQYIIPIHNEKGTIVDLRRYKIGQHGVRSSPGCSLHLLGMNRIDRYPRRRIYVCEGEWDAIALLHIHHQSNNPSVVVAVPGASTFKDYWVQYFAGRKVRTLYDNDGPGLAGEQRAYGKLVDSVAQIQFCHWPPKLPNKFDTRDWVINGLDDPHRCWTNLRKLFHDTPRITDENTPVDEKKKKRIIDPIALSQVHDVFNKWLYLDDMLGLDVCLSVALSQGISGDPLWMFLVASPGGCKTELLSAFRGIPEHVVFVDALTPRTLMSGAGTQKNDPSLLPKLSGKVMVLKDFTNVLQMSDHDRGEITSTLRGAYDGYATKSFGHGIKRDFQGYFSIIAGVTPRIYYYTTLDSSMGERFIMYLLGENIHHVNEREIIAQAMRNVSKEERMREEMQDAVTRYLEQRWGALDRLPDLSGETHEKTLSLAQLVGLTRGAVVRGKYQTDQIEGRPIREVGARLGKQFKKLGVSLAAMRGHEKVMEEDYAVVRKCALDTMPQRREDILRALRIHAPHEQDVVSEKEIAFFTRYNRSTTRRVLEDMMLLHIVEQDGRMFRLSDPVRKLIIHSGLYTTTTERSGRPQRDAIRPQPRKDRSDSRVRRVRRKPKNRS